MQICKPESREEGPQYEAYQRKGAEYDAFWQRYLMNKMMSRKESLAVQLDYVYRTAVRLWQFTHPTNNVSELYHILRHMSSHTVLSLDGNWNTQAIGASSMTSATISTLQRWPF